MIPRSHPYTYPVSFQCAASSPSPSHSPSPSPPPPANSPPGPRRPTSLRRAGCPMAGYYSVRGAEGTHDPLHAKALVLEKDGTKVALVALDLISTTRGLVEETARIVEKETGIPGKNVMISATHSHTGPVLWGRPARRTAWRRSQIAQDYIKDLPAKIAAAVKKADAARKPAQVSFGVGKEDGLAFNRRFHMTDGSVGWNPGKKNPKIVRPAGPTDPVRPGRALRDGRREAEADRHLRQLRHAPRHRRRPVLLRRLPVHARESARGGEGRRAGDGVHDRHVRRHQPRQRRTTPTPQKGHGEAARIGTRLAGEVLRTFDRLKPAADGPLRVSSAMVELPLPTVTPDDDGRGEACDRRMCKPRKKPAPKFLDQVQAFKAVDVADRLGKPHAVEVQVISLGDDLAWVSLPGEIFVDLGLQVKHGSPFQQTMIAELANGSDRLRPEPRGVFAGELRGGEQPVRRGQRGNAGGRGAEAVAGAVWEVRAMASRERKRPEESSSGRLRSRSLSHPFLLFTLPLHLLKSPGVEHVVLRQPAAAGDVDAVAVQFQLARCCGRPG